MAHLICECMECNVSWAMDFEESPCSCNTSDAALQRSIDTQHLVEVGASDWREALSLYRSGYAIEAAR